MKALCLLIWLQGQEQADVEELVKMYAIKTVILVYVRVQTFVPDVMKILSGISEI